MSRSIETSRRWVANALTTRTKLEQLAEEDAETAQAALKVIRALDLSGNPTPVNAEQAWADLSEELSDVILCASMLPVRIVKPRRNRKAVRWEQRLKTPEK